jgi:AcrR family transcriptional regulator
MPADQRREQLMDAALDVIVRDGYRAVSIESIVREVGVTRPVFYKVYNGLDALLSELLERQEQRALRQLMTTIAPPSAGTDFEKYLQVTIRSLVAMVRDDPRTWTPIFLAAVDTPPAVRGRITRDREAIRVRFREFLRVAVAARSQIDADVLAHSMVAIGEYFARMILEDPDSVDADRLAATATALFLPRPN